MDILEKIIPKLGQTIGRYQLVEELGRGGFGVVFRAKQIGLDADVAIKVMIPPVSSKAEQLQILERFQQEAQVIKQLEHSAALKVRDFGRTPEGLPYLVTEYVRGRELAAVLRESPLSLERTIRVSKQVLSCLAEAHHLRILHRDLKPANLMLRDIFGEQDSVKVLDFGISKILGEGGVKTQTGLRFGTPWYMAPEQAKGLKEIDGRLDLYAFGLIMAECLTGRRVVTIEDLTGALLQQASPEPLTFEPAVMQSPLFPVIQTATQKDPNHRFPNAIAMREAIEGVEVKLLVATQAASGPIPAGPAASATALTAAAPVASQPVLVPPPTPASPIVTPSPHLGRTTPFPEPIPASQPVSAVPPSWDSRKTLVIVAAVLGMVAGILFVVIPSGEDETEGTDPALTGGDRELTLCDQATTHFLDCLERFCGDPTHVDIPGCQEADLDALRQRPPEGAVCDERTQAEAAGLLEASCTDIIRDFELETPSSEFQIVVDDAQRALDEGRWLDAIHAARDVPVDDALHDRARDIIIGATDHILDNAQAALNEASFDEARRLVEELFQAAPGDRVEAFEVELNTAQQLHDEEMARQAERELEEERAREEREPEAHFETGSGSIRGQLSRDAIQRVVRQHRREVLHCYEQELERDPELAGRVVVGFTIYPTGSVASVEIRTSNLGNDDVQECLVRRIGRWQFPEPEGGVVTVSYPFVFSSD